jgi:hypothetical protein
METSLRKQIQSILISDYRGPKASYGEVDVLKALLAIGNSEGSLGRFKLGRETGLGQGEVRTLIARLKDAGLVTVDARGCALTERGRKKFQSISKAIPESYSVESESLDLGGYSWFVVLRDRASKVKKGLEQRDAAIRAGATGAFTAVYSNERFFVPSGETPEDCERLGPTEPWTTIRQRAVLHDGDVVILSGADSERLAEEGALGAALTLL